MLQTFVHKDAVYIMDLRALDCRVPPKLELVTAAELITGLTRVRRSCRARRSQPFCAWAIRLTRSCCAIAVLCLLQAVFCTLGDKSVLVTCHRGGAVVRTIDPVATVGSVKLKDLGVGDAEGARLSRIAVGRTRCSVPTRAAVCMTAPLVGCPRAAPYHFVQCAVEAVGTKTIMLGAWCSWQLWAIGDPTTNPIPASLAADTCVCRLGCRDYMG